MSTRNRNTREDYSVEQKLNERFFDYQTLPSYANTDDKYYFSLGSVPSSSRHQLSYNHVDTESMLRNIGATNLENPNSKITPRDKSKQLKDGLFYDIKPVIMPQTMTIFKNQRPGPM